MDWQSPLGSAIEVAIGLAGFSGIVAAVGRRGAGHWTAIDQVRLRVLLTASGMALVWAFLPFLLVDAVDLAAFWRIGSAAIACWYIAMAIRRSRQSSGILARTSIRWPLSMVFHASVVAALFANALFFGSPSLYVLGVLWELVIAFTAFVDLLLASWQAGDAASPPAARGDGAGG